LSSGLAHNTCVYAIEYISYIATGQVLPLKTPVAVKFKGYFFCITI